MTTTNSIEDELTKNYGSHSLLRLTCKRQITEYKLEMSQDVIRLAKSAFIQKRGNLNA